MVKFPFNAHTRAGSVVTITGYYKGYDRPWVGIIDLDLVDAHINYPATWMEGGHYISNEIERAFDLIDLPQ
jgi:hypothetical protein